MHICVDSLNNNCNGPSTFIYLQKTHYLIAYSDKNTSNWPGYMYIMFLVYKKKQIQIPMMQDISQGHNSDMGERDIKNGQNFRRLLWTTPK